MEGEILSLDEMDTKHIFNSMKMIFNHICEVYGIPTVWHQHRYRDYIIKSHIIPKKLARQIHLFISEIERRGDLPSKYHEPYRQILDTIRFAVNSQPELIAVTKAIPVGPRAEGE